jgi:hypothetical protein
MGVLFEDGRAVVTDPAEAMRWYRSAAGKGNAAAQYKLGNGYYSGRGVPRDYYEAARWFRKAAEQGRAEA